MERLHMITKCRSFSPFGVEACRVHDDHGFKEELIDGINYAGVTSYLGDASEAGGNLFI